MDITFDFYCDKAIQRMNYKGDCELADAIHISKAALSSLRKNKALPSENTIVRISELAGMPTEIALIDLNLWKAKSKQNEQVYRNWLIIKQLCQKR